MSGLYLHVPFCRQKCNYCDFFSAPPQGDQLESWHLLLAKNLSLLAESHTGPLETIFFGGGTPSLLSPEQVAFVLDSAEKQFGFCADIEISLEANPADLSRDYLAGLRSAGINRLSIGVQSFSDQQLKQLGRRHSSDQAKQAVWMARDLGFDNLSLDLIFALPGQSREDLLSDIDSLVELAPDHVGIYGLSVEPGTPLAREVAAGQLEEADEEDYALFYKTISAQLEVADFEHYEISNFARPGARCRHNLAYWQRKACLAAGAGAHGFAADGYGRRTAIPTDLGFYRDKLDTNQDPAELLESFDRNQAMAETLYLGLRTREGVDCIRFEEIFGVSPKDAYPDALKKLSPYLVEQGHHWRFSLDGWLLFDHLVSHFL